MRGEARVPRLVIFIFCKNSLLILTNAIFVFAFRDKFRFKFKLP